MTIKDIIETLKNIGNEDEEVIVNNETSNKEREIESNENNEITENEEQDETKILLKQALKEIVSLKQQNAELLNSTSVENKPSTEELLYKIYNESEGYSDGE